MKASQHSLMNHRYKQAENEGISSRTIGLISRSPYPCLGDDERDMDKRTSTQQTRKLPNNQPYGMRGPQTSTRNVNPRGPHQSGTQGRLISSSSNVSSLSDSSSSSYNQMTGTHPYELSTHSHPISNTARRSEDPQQYQYTSEPYSRYSTGPQTDPYSSATHQYIHDVVPTRPTTHSRVQSPRYGVGQSYDNPTYTPGSELYSSPYNQAYIPVTSHLPYSSQPRQMTNLSSHLIKTNSTGSFRETRPYDIDTSSQRGYSSLGDLPCDTHVYGQQSSMVPQYMYNSGSDHSHSNQQTHVQCRVTQCSPLQYSSSRSPDSAEYGSISAIDALADSTDSLSLSGDPVDIEIIKHPESLTVATREKAVFMCEARVRCREPANLLWYKDQEPLIGEIDSSYVIQETTEKDAGIYHCHVTHPVDTSKQKDSFSATLVITPQDDSSTAKPPTIVKQPMSKVTGVVGEPMELTIEADGEEPIRFQWYKNSQAMPFGQTATLRYPVATPGDSGSYSCGLSNARGSIMSRPYFVEVTMIRDSKKSKIVKPSDLNDSYLRSVSVVVARQLRSLDELAHLLGVKVSNVASFPTSEEQIFHLLRMWKENNNGNKQTLHFILNRANIVLRNVVEGPVCHPPPAAPQVKPRIVVQPQSAKVRYGNPLTLQIQVANITSSTKYQWHRNQRALTGRTVPRLAISSVIDSDVGEYVCVVCDGNNRVVSEPAIVELHDPSYGYHSVNPPPQELLYDGYIRDGHFLLGRGGDDPLPKEQQPLLEPKANKTGPSPLQDIVIVEHPQSVEVELGDPLTLTCKASSSNGDLKYNWFFNGLLINEEDQSEYVLNCFTDEDEGFYSCKVSNKYGSLITNTAQVKVKIESD